MNVAQPKLIRTKVFVLALIVWWLVALIARVEAARPAVNCSPANAAITAPQSGATIVGVVQIEGVASLGNEFQKYTLEYSPASRDAFTTLGGEVKQPVTNGQLGVWDSVSVPDGEYKLRLRVVDLTGNYCEAIVTGVHVVNAAPLLPTETSTPIETEAPPAFAVVPTAAPVTRVPQGTALPNTGQTPSPQAKVTRISTTNAPVPGVTNTGSVSDALGQLLGRFARVFLFGTLAMAGIMLIVGVVFFVRRVL